LRIVAKYNQISQITTTLEGINRAIAVRSLNPTCFYFRIISKYEPLSLITGTLSRNSGVSAANFTNYNDA